MQQVKRIPLLDLILLLRCNLSDEDKSVVKGVIKSQKKYPRLSKGAYNLYLSIFKKYEQEFKTISAQFKKI